MRKEIHKDLVGNPESKSRPARHSHRDENNIKVHLQSYCGPGSSVGIATGYGLYGRGSESRGGEEIFRTSPDRPCDPRNLLYNGYRVFPGGKERPGRDADLLPPSSAAVKQE